MFGFQKKAVASSILDQDDLKLGDQGNAADGLAETNLAEAEQEPEVSFKGLDL